ncbi:MAG: hypothetical protein JWO31_3619, partial [Phycisphaerales bacterium]|nr:hypothetical protein [Phycisphaerales bacterium]
GGGVGARAGGGGGAAHRSLAAAVVVTLAAKAVSSPDLSTPALWAALASATSVLAAPAAVTAATAGRGRVWWAEIDGDAGPDEADDSVPPSRAALADV